jgi:hypothetical protein
MMSMVSRPMGTVNALGFTGSRNGMTSAQRTAVMGLLLRLRPLVVHHGDCVGADADFHALVREVALRTRVMIHPPSAKELRAYCRGDGYYEPTGYLRRDRDIVDASEFIVGTPASQKAPTKRRGGTWYTLDYAEQRRKPSAIVFVDGDMLESP